jgi:hypothetical protein
LKTTKANAATTRDSLIQGNHGVHEVAAAVRHGVAGAGRGGLARD